MRLLSGSGRVIARDTTWSLVAEGARLFSSIATFLLVARSLGPDNYGLFVGTSAFVTIISPFANLGAPLLMLQRVRREGCEPTAAFRTAVSMVLGGGLGAVVLTAVVGSALITGAPVIALVAVAVGDFIFAGMLQLCSGLALAAGDMRWYALAIGLGSAARLAAAALFLGLASDSVISWALVQLAALVVTSIAVVARSCLRFDVPFGYGQVTRRDVIDGVPYSASIAVFSAQDGVDKPLMVRYGWGPEAGYYAAAYRVPSLAFMPVQALIVATLNRSFVAGREGVGPALALAKRLLMPALAYSLAVGAAIVAFAPVFRPILGDDFEGAVGIMRWAAFLPALRTLQYFPANALTGAGKQRLRLVLLIVTFVVNLALCLLLVPTHSWRGALVATVAAETVYALILWLAALLLARRESASAKAA